MDKNAIVRTGIPILILIFILLVLLIRNCNNDSNDSSPQCRCDEKAETFFKDNSLTALETQKLKNCLKSSNKNESCYLKANVTNNGNWDYKVLGSQIRHLADSIEGINEEDVTIQLKPKINLFVDNTLDMDGYLDAEDPEFKFCIEKLLRNNIEVSNKYGNLTFYYANTDVHKLSINSSEQFLDGFNTKQKSPYKSTGDTNNTFLEKILKNMFKETEENDISIFYSNCIYGGKDEKQSIGSKIKQPFQNKLNSINYSKFSTYIYRYLSNFNGEYFNKFGKNFPIKIDRSYFVWVFGPEELVKSFIQEIDFEQLPRYQNRFHLDYPEQNNPPYFTVLRDYKNKGTFRPNKKLWKTGQYIRGIKNVRPTYHGKEKGVFQFSVAIDQSNIKVDNSKKLLMKNSYKTNKNYKIQDIEPVDSIKKDIAHGPTKKMIKQHQPTHVLTLRTQTDPSLLSDLKVSLKHPIPEWVNDYSVEDDKYMKKPEKRDAKTRNLKEWIGAVYEAYKEKSPEDKLYHYRINIPVN